MIADLAIAIGMGACTTIASCFVGVLYASKEYAQALAVLVLVAALGTLSYVGASSVVAYSNIEADLRIYNDPITRLDVHSTPKTVSFNSRKDCSLAKNDQGNWRVITGSCRSQINPPKPILDEPAGSK